MDWIRPGQLAIGNFADAPLAEAAGIRAVLSLTGEHEPVHPRTVRIPLVDDGSNAPALMVRAIRELDRLLRESPPVLVHCHAGVSRSVAIVAGYLVAFEGFELNAAFVFIDERRRIGLSPGVLPSLRKALVLLGDEPRRAGRG